MSKNPVMDNLLSVVTSRVTDIQSRLDAIIALCQRYNNPSVNPGAHALAGKILQIATKEAEK